MVYWRQWLEKRCPQGEGYTHMYRLRNQCFVHVSNFDLVGLGCLLRKQENDESASSQ